MDWPYDVERCRWCGVRLRWWQLTHCRMCHRALVEDWPGPPCQWQSRKTERPDRAFRWMEVAAS